LSTKTLREVAIEGGKDELTDHAVYKRLSTLGVGRNREFNKTLAKLAATELGHYEFWKKYAPDEEIKANRLGVFLAILVKLILGTTFAVRYLERNETNVIRRYKSVAHMIPPEDTERFQLMLNDEEEHEKGFELQIQGGLVLYISFVVLGIADAVVEISGIHAGSLGIYNSTRLAGLAGVVAGGAASIAMASAAFAQAKQGFQGSARVAAVYTGISYFATAVVLASPYFFTETMTLALGASLFLAVLLVAFNSFYSTVISGKSFSRDFLSITGVMFGATLALYILGIVIRYVFGISV
jgi:VIT1/CCC1 family predicted Fe2+/Mn2+ transporter